MTCLTVPVSTAASHSHPTPPADSLLDVIRERLYAGHYDRPDILDELAERLVRVVSAADA